MWNININKNNRLHIHLSSAFITGPHILINNIRTEWIHRLLEICLASYCHLNLAYEGQRGKFSKYWSASLVSLTEGRSAFLPHSIQSYFQADIHLYNLTQTASESLNVIGRYVSLIFEWENILRKLQWSVTPNILTVFKMTSDREKWRIRT